MFYDVTNYYFEIDKEDDLRRYGVSKEHRKSPIVQMGLVQDASGIPISYKLFPRNTQDSATMLDVLKNLKADHKLERVVCVTDKGLNCSRNIAGCVAAGDGFVFSQSIRGTKSGSELRAWVLDDADYRQGSKHEDNCGKGDSKQNSKREGDFIQDSEHTGTFKIKSRQGTKQYI